MVKPHQQGFWHPSVRLLHVIIHTTPRNMHLYAKWSHGLYVNPLTIPRMIKKLFLSIKFLMLPILVIQELLLVQRTVMLLMRSESAWIECVDTVLLMVWIPGNYHYMNNEGKTPHWMCEWMSALFLFFNDYNGTELLFHSLERALIQNSKTRLNSFLDASI